MTLGSDLLLELKADWNESPIIDKDHEDDDKQYHEDDEDEDSDAEELTWLIPVHKTILVKKIPYFKGLFESEGFWEDSQNHDEIENCKKLPIRKLGNVSNSTIFRFIELLYARSIYDKNDLKFSTDNYITRDNVFEFIELSQFWMVDDMKYEAVSYVERYMDNELMMAALVFDNQPVREMVQIISNTFIIASAARHSKATSLKEKAILSLRGIRNNIDSATKYLEYPQNNFNKTTTNQYLKRAEEKIDEATAIIKCI